ncbi:MAG: hypothetical protein H6740_14950 [Alphaproteobacteria bacterium]|nr:hypothetical protein [Alphaproteobacteria bacterium]
MAAPALDLDWELGLFKALRGLWRAVAPAPELPYDPTRAALLEDMAPRARLVASLIAERPLRVQPAREIGGVRGQDLLMPPWIELAADPEVNRSAYLVRAAVNGAMAKLAAESEGPLDEAFTLWSVQRAAARLQRELPRFGEPWQRACALALTRRPPLLRLQGRADLLERWRRTLLVGLTLPEVSEMRRALSSAPSRGPESPEVLLWGRLIPCALRPEGSDDAAEPLGRRPGEEVAAPPVEEVQLLKLEEQRELELPTHVFEKVETLEGFSGSLRQLDGEDELDEHLEALEEVDLGALVRGGPEAPALLRAEVGLEIDVPDVADVTDDEPCVFYPEWDQRRRAFRERWCRVVPTALGAGDPSWALEAAARHQALITRVHRRLEAARHERRVRPRQLDGDDIDLDAVVDAQATFAAGREPDPRLYRAPRRHSRDVATLLLLDLSLSTDSWVEGRRVLDVAREATLVLGEVSARLDERLAVMGFASHTRNKVRAFGVKQWEEPWAMARSRLGGLKPQGYTRLGPALRHATAALEAVEAKHRVLLLVTDGKPTDYDRYEGRYGLADVRCAVRQARAKGMLVHALAVDRRAHVGLPEMMGPGGWSLLPHPEALPEALAGLWARIHEGR